ncbi:ABC transporter ATP-binding protein [Haloarcula pellucida]|uniref:Molybdate/tungstate import ATP-binding protein WtpC n=1 Tax=Haloarcula pellucida TaxID=1427151 RepID=A0A830GIS4_9EURY|nr:ABC transporter ATP-binding protein [Halomicroarcula pellucida]MBX0348772.1 ABC transporter ATP-binding protein [Halomicroarcula pellucida]GGN91869.1 polyamine-transporting ATPase [Halomicroarcula pellucida]
MARVTIDSVRKVYDDTVAVENVSLTVPDGEILGLLGPSGCGKTTTLRTVAGFETPTEGTVAFDDEDVTHVPPEDRNIGLVFQTYALFDNMTVGENVAFGLKMRGVDPAKRRARAEELLELLGIGGLSDRDPQTLSGGQQQRVGLARALAIEPRVLLLDEPMTGLDAKLKRRLRNELGELLDELGVTALYVTHDQAEAMSMCDRIAVMNDGHVEQVGTPREVYERPANAFVADFVGTANVLDGVVSDGTLDLGFERVPAAGAPEGPATVVARPEAFRADSDGEIPVAVTERTYQGDHVRATVTLPDETAVTLRLDPATLTDDENVRLTLDPTALHVTDVDVEADSDGAVIPN